MQWLVRSAAGWAIASLCCIVSCGGCDRNESGGSGKPPASAPTTTASTEAASADAPHYALTAEEYADEYHRDATKAARKYKHAAIEISGTVKDVQFDAAGRAWVNLKIGNEVTGVQCFTKDPNPWEKVAAGQHVRLSGAWPEFPLVPSLRECELVDSGASTAISMTAQELADEYGADADAAARKYAGKTLLVSGEVFDKTMEGIEHWVMLKGNYNVNIRCDFSPVEREGKVIAAIQGGQTVRIWGELSNLDLRKSVAVLSPSRLMPN